ncbi:OmpW/AlkL family protein [Solimicrobium silvestre]|uniref:Outer membrane insertion C-terminal signal n=1 Tax=Solimicrobium silvestre TaxID=2099400 RepID=A0A2S9GVC6_9BURK|nr:OmpW family outer membrane protein [Solimicrobium silvestre]PRC91682.1 Outer membrane insertion C-terminal signal [Solimicrobium silvestre]
MSSQLTTLYKISALAVAAISSASASAQSAGDTIVSAGWAHIAPQDSSTPLRITSPMSASLPGSGASVDPTNTLGFSVTRFLTDNWATSLDLGIPPTYKLQGTGSLASVGQIGEAKQWAPTLLGKYFFADSNAQFRPFVGVGATYVRYTDISLTQNFQQTVAGTLGLLSQGAIKATDTSAKLSSSWAPVVNVGINYAITKDWSASFSVSYVRLKTTADLTTTTNVGPVLSTTKLTLNPIVTYLSVGYRF